jgi:NAD(P)H dehydrogenase (quinone)
MSRNILVIQGHPRAESLCGALAAAYAEGASASAHPVRRLELSGLRFDPVLHGGFEGSQPLEPALVKAQEDLAWADHLVFVYPVWWGGPPAVLKGFVDRTFLPGFAFKYRERGSLWDKLFTGKSARLIVTADSPGWWLSLVTGNPAVKLMKGPVLDFCGVAPVRTTVLPLVRRSSPQRRAAWLHDVRQLGAVAA